MNSALLLIDEDFHEGAQLEGRFCHAVIARPARIAAHQSTMLWQPTALKVQRPMRHPRREVWRHPRPPDGVSSPALLGPSLSAEVVAQSDLQPQWPASLRVRGRRAPLVSLSMASRALSRIV